MIASASLVTAACGGGSGEGATPPTTGAVPDSSTADDAAPGPDATIDPADIGALMSLVDIERLEADIAAVATTASEALGDPAGAEAIVFALERGYSADQLSGRGGALEPDGRLASLSPERSRQGVVILPGEGDADAEGLESLVGQPQGLRRATVGPLGEVDISTLFTAALKDGGTSVAFAVAVISLDQSGYSLEQIRAAVFAGSNVWTEDDGCVRIGFAPVRPSRIDSSCAIGIDRLADQNEAIDQQNPPTETGTPPVEPAADADPSGDALLGDGTYRGPIDLLGFYEIAFAEAVPHITVAGSELVVVIEQGMLVSLSGSARTSNPEVELSDSTLCGTDLTWTFESSGSGASATAAGINAPTIVAVTGTNFCDGETELEDDSSELTATVIADPETGGLAVTFGADGDSAGITAALE